MQGSGNKRRILIVHNYYQLPGGEDTVVANEKKMLEDRGHEVILYTRSNAELKHMSKIRKVILPLVSVFNWRTYRDIKKMIKSRKIEIVHVHNTLHLISPAVYYAALSCRIPVVQTVHNFRLLCPGAVFYRGGQICEDCVNESLWCAVKHGCYRGSKLQTFLCAINTVIHRRTGVYGKLNYICLTEFNKKKLLQMKQIQAGHVFIKPNFTYGQEEAYFKSVNGESRKDQFVFVGRLEQLKGIDMLLRVWQRLGNQFSRLIVCGTGELDNWCREFVKEKDIRNIEFRGVIPNRDVKKIIGESRALILPSRCYEGFPMSIAEAYSMGTPVIGPNVGNIDGLIRQGITGVKYKYNDEVSLQETIYRFSRQEWKKVRENYEEYLSEEGNYNILRDIYEKIVELY